MKDFRKPSNNSGVNTIADIRRTISSLSVNNLKSELGESNQKKNCWNIKLLIQKIIYMWLDILIELKNEKLVINIIVDL